MYGTCKTHTEGTAIWFDTPASLPSTAARAGLGTSQCPACLRVMYGVMPSLERCCAQGPSNASKEGQRGGGRGGESMQVHQFAATRTQECTCHTAYRSAPPTYART